MKKFKAWIKSLEMIDVTIAIVSILAVISFAFLAYYTTRYIDDYSEINSAERYNISFYQDGRRIARYAGEVINETEEEITIKTSDGDEYRVQLTDGVTYIVKDN